MSVQDDIVQLNEVILNNINNNFYRKNVEDDSDDNENLSEIELEQQKNEIQSLVPSWS